MLLDEKNAREDRCLKILRAATAEIPSSCSWASSDAEVFSLIQKLPYEDRRIIRDALRATLKEGWGQ